MSTTPSSFPTVTANLSVVLSIPVAMDINTQWLAQKQGSPRTLANAMAATDTSLTLAPSTSLNAPIVAVGSSLLVDQEPMKVTAINGAQYTLTRTQVTPLVAAPSAHAAGATVFLLSYPDPWSMIADQALRPYAQQVVIGLGANSAIFGSQASGSLTINS